MIEGTVDACVSFTKSLKAKLLNILKISYLTLSKIGIHYDQDLQLDLRRFELSIFVNLFSPSAYLNGINWIAISEIFHHCHLLNNTFSNFSDQHQVLLLGLMIIMV